MIINDFQKLIWQNNYKAPSDNTILDTFKRVALTVAAVELDKLTRRILYLKFYQFMSLWKFIPGGRIIANAGVKERPKATLYNCYVYHPYDFGIRDIDSMLGIFLALKKSAKILASEGGLGINATFIRPNGSLIEGTGATTPGVLKFLELWDKASLVITMGSTIKVKESDKAKKKVRKGAMMCFSLNTLILTDKGWLFILDIFDRLENGEEVKCKYVDGTYHTVKNPFMTLPCLIYIVLTLDGTKVECTANHRFEVYNIETELTYLKKICDIDPEILMLTVILLDLK